MDDCLNKDAGIIFEENFFKLTENLDLILKVIGAKITNNQTASLVKAFFIFADTLINIYKIKNFVFTDIEINILLNLFCDKLLCTNTIFKETACNLIWFLNDSIDNAKTIIMLVHLIPYKTAKLKNEIIDIILKFYENSNFDVNVNCKILKDLIRVYFDGDNSLKKKIVPILQEIYNLIGDEFWKYTKILSSDNKDELFKILTQSDENEIKSIGQDISYDYEIDDHSNFVEDMDLNVINGNNNNNINTNLNNKNNNINNNNTEAVEKKVKSKKLFSKSNSFDYKENKKNKTLHNYGTNIINNPNMNENDSSLPITSEELNEALKMLVDPEEDIVEAILTIHDITFRNYLKNKEIIINNSENIINTFIEVISKLFTSNPLPIKIIKYITNVLCKLCGIKDIINSISINVLHNLFILILSGILYENLNTMGENKEGLYIWKNFNSIISHLINFCDITKNIVVILKISKKFFKSKPKLAEYSARCLVIINQRIKDNYSLINVENVLNEVYNLLVEFEKCEPDLQLKNKMERNIIITARNLINELVKVRREKFLEDYNNWSKKYDIKKEKYILKWINESIKILDKNQAAVNKVEDKKTNENEEKENGRDLNISERYDDNN